MKRFLSKKRCGGYAVLSGLLLMLCACAEVRTLEEMETFRDSSDPECRILWRLQRKAFHDFKASRFRTPTPVAARFFHRGADHNVRVSLFLNSKNDIDGVRLVGPDSALNLNVSLYPRPAPDGGSFLFEADCPFESSRTPETLETAYRCLFLTRGGKIVSDPVWIFREKDTAFLLRLLKQRETELSE